MTLNEAIKHCEEVAEEQEKSCEVYGSLKKHHSGLYERLAAENNERKCAECAADHRQLAEWLTELKERREAGVKRGKWVYYKNNGIWDIHKCTVCNTPFELPMDVVASSVFCYCPHCGADMRGEDNAKG